MTAWSCVCQHCGIRVRTVGGRLNDEALQALREHCLVTHADARLAVDTHAGAVLAHFDVDRDG